MSGTVLTNKGLALITKLVAASTELQISRVAVGTGRVPSGVDPQTMVDLNEYKMDAQIESYGVSPDQSDVAYIAAQVSSIGVSAGFAVTEAGVLCNRSGCRRDLVCVSGSYRGSAVYLCGNGCNQQICGDHV